MISLDLETTGLTPGEDRIIQIAIVGDVYYNTLINPQRPIPAEITELTGITDELVSNLLPFENHAEQIVQLLAGQTVVGFNHKMFDIPFLAAELDRVGVAFDWSQVTLVDVSSLYRHLRPRTLEAAVREFLGREGSRHNAAIDAQDTLDVLGIMQSQVDHETLLDVAYSKIADPAGKLKWLAGDIVYAFGKHHGKPVRQHPDYARWMLEQDFPLSTKRVLRNILYGGQTARDVAY